MKKNFVVAIFIAIAAIACGPKPSSTGSDVAANDANDLAELSSDLGDVGKIAPVDGNGPQATASGERVINGDTGTVTITWSREINEDGMTRTRTLTFKDYTKKGSIKLSNLNGELTYSFTLTRENDSPATVTRTLKGKVSATRTNKDGTTEDVTLEPDFTFTRDPVQRCVHMTGSLTLNGKKNDFQEKAHCRS